MNKIFTISNFLSISRIIILPYVVYCLKNNSYKNNPFFFVVLIYFMASDFFDGFLARKLNQITKLGKILDPLADKIAILTMSILMYLYKDFPIWAVFIIVIREIIILLGSTMLMKKKDFIPTSHIIGKSAVFFISLSLLGYLFLNQVSLIPYTFLIIGLTLYIISFILYFLHYLTLMEYIQKFVHKLYEILHHNHQGI